jgi:ubiquinone/menaquinone biosynthesis C-methylase UbiE
MVKGIAKRHWVKLGMRLLRLYLNEKHPSTNVIQSGYNEIASVYDTYWTEQMSVLSLDLLKKLNPMKGADCLDLTCGTGFVTHALYEMTKGNIIGVDVSEGMIAIAQQYYGDTCQFITDDVHMYLKKQPACSLDYITCAWGLGYLTPDVLLEIFRVLREGGKVGIIDNSLFSHWEFVWFFLVAVAEDPAQLLTYFKPHFFISAGTLAHRMQRNGFRILRTWSGEKIGRVHDKERVMEQLINSGVTAGILHLLDENQKEKTIKRISQLLLTRYVTKQYIPITHRYIAVIGEKKPLIVKGNRCQ